MARFVKCYGDCGVKYPQDEMTKFNNLNYCPSCHAKKVKEVQDRELLYNLLKMTFSINFPTGLMLRQVKQFREERQYTYKNIAFTVKYMLEVKKIKLQMQYGIALVPHYYDEMLTYYKNLKEKRENTKFMKQEIVTIKIKPFVFHNKYKENKFIDMNTLLKEDTINDAD